MRVPRGRSLWSSRLSADEQGRSPTAIVDELRRVILAGDAPPGTAIPVDDVAELFGVSRIPVREALKTLVAEGLVAQRPGSGYAVARLTRDELAQFYSVRGLLELAILQPAVAAASADDDELVRQAHAALDRAVSCGDIFGHHLQSRRFHLALLAPSGMDRMIAMLEAAWNMTEPVQPMMYAGPGQSAQFHADHQKMMEAFLARDATALLDASRRHQANLEAVIAVLPGHRGLFLDD